jgi:hypothetical protein
MFYPTWFIVHKTRTHEIASLRQKFPRFFDLAWLELGFSGQGRGLTVLFNARDTG